MSEEKRTFIITPIGEPNSAINQAARGLIDTIIKPVLTELGYEIDNPMDDSSSGSITKQIIKNIVNDELVIVNLTGINPNVMYELSLRHATNKPVVVLIRKDQLSSIPFDIKDERVIPFADVLYGVDKLKKTLKNHIMSAIEDNPNSPIYNATQQVNFVGGDKKTEDIASAIENIKEDIGILKKRQVDSIRMSNTKFDNPMLTDYEETRYNMDPTELRSVDWALNSLHKQHGINED